MEILNNMLDGSQVPVLTALVLGLLTALSPCPLATNIAAVGYISKDIEDRRRIFWNGLLYTIGRIVAYCMLGVVLIAILRQGASIFHVQKFISHLGEQLLPVMLIVIGIVMLFGDRLPLPKFGFTGKTSRPISGSLGSLLLGVLFAMAFCPTSALFYFGILIPMSAGSDWGYLLPVIFAVAIGLPVVIVAWTLAFSVKSLGTFYNCMKTLQQWLSITVAVIFILVGCYYLLMNYGLI